MKQLTLCILAVFLLTAMLFGCGGSPETTPTTVPETTEPPLPGVLFQVPEGVSLQVYPGFTDQPYEVLAQWAETADGIYSVYYPDLEGTCHYIASGEGYYTVRRNLLIPANSSMVINADPGKRTGTGCEPSLTSTVWQPTDQFVENAAPSDPDLWPEIADAFTTPWFTNRDRGVHQSTTHGEMMAFLQAMDDADDALYLYSLGQSPSKNLEMPLLIFTQTDLSGASTWQEAAALLQDNGKLTVHFQAQIHGNEPAAGEGALALAKLLDGQLGTQLLDTMDIYLVPRVNIDGSEAYARHDRRVDVDMNRDMLLALTTEVQLHHQLLQTFQPHVRFDAHEFDGRCDATTQKYPDVTVSTGFTLHNSQEFQEFSGDLAGIPFEALQEKGLRATYYSGDVNGYNSTTGRIYACNRGTVSILIETKGIHMGTNLYARRVASHVLTAREYLSYLSENADKVMDLVARERSRIIELGSVYDEEDLLPLQTGAVQDAKYLNPEPKLSMADGTEMEVDRKRPKVYNVPQRTRVRPTAYVLPADTAEIELILQIMEHHGIAYYSLPAGSSVALEQYRMNGDAVELVPENRVYFETEAYVFPMNQLAGNILSILMEPDVNDVAANRGTLAQLGLIDKDGSLYRLYRYTHDLDETEKIS